MKLNYPAKSVFSACLAYATIGIGYTSDVQAQTAKVIKVKTDHSIAKVQPNMWGVFFEDINFGADGGIYAELIKNRSFEFAKPLMGWSFQPKKPQEGELLVVNRKEVNTANPRYLQVKKQTDDFELVNEGFKGIGVKKGLRYDFSVMYRQSTPGLNLYSC